MIVGLRFVFPLSPGHSIYSVLARGATLENLSVYDYYSLQYWCVGAALLAKALDCAVGSVAFGKCAAWVGFTVGYDNPAFSRFMQTIVEFELK
jgi:hypothetical protein